MKPSYYQQPRASDLFDVLAYDPESALFIMEDRSLGFGFLCLPLAGGDQSLADRLNVFLNGDWPTDTLIQISLFTSPDLGHCLKASKATQGSTKEPILSALHHSAKRYFLEGTRRPLDEVTGLRLRRAEILITIKLPLKAPCPNDQEEDKARQLQKASLQALKTIGIQPKVLTAEGFLRSMAVLLNWKKTSHWVDAGAERADPHQLLRNQILDFNQELKVDAEGLFLGKKRVKTLSVKRYPDYLAFGAAQHYLGDLLTGHRGIRQNTLITLTLHYPDQEATRSQLESVRQWVTTQADGPMVRFLPGLKSRKESFDILFDAFQDGDRPIRAAFSMILFCDPEEDAEAISNARVYYRELGFQLLEDRFFCLPIFLNSLPLGADRAFIRDSQRYRTFSTRHIVPLLPLFADWQGTGSNTLQLVSRQGQWMGFSLFDSGTNYNASIAAQSGSGKSFLTNELIVSHLYEGAKVWVIDVGRSYQNLAETLGGTFIAFDSDRHFSLNPFSLIRDWHEEADAIAGLVIAMAAPTEKLTDFQTASLKRLLKESFDKEGSAMTIGGVSKRLLMEEDRRLKDLGSQLFPFTPEGEYGRYFEGQHSIRFEGDFTVLELEELKGRRHLQQVVLLQLIYQIQQAMYLGDRGRQKIVIIDESWDLLTQSDAASFIEHGYRRFRKYGGSAVTITQSVNDLYGTSTGRAIAENSAHLILLGQKSEAIDALDKEKRLPLDEAGIRHLKSLKTVPGRYSELFILGDRGAGIGRLMVDPFRRLLYSTRPQDVADIKAEKMKGFDVIEAVREVMALRHQGEGHG